MADPRIRVQHLLLTTLRSLDKEAATRFTCPLSCPPGFGSIGLILNSRLDQSRYSFCTPLNCRTFAGTGGDGTHFSLLILDGQITKQSPVVMTLPPVGQTVVVGASLFDFLCLGCHRGYFALEQLVYNLDLSLEVYTNPDWGPSEKWHYSVGFVPDKFGRQLLRFLTESLGLESWDSLNQFRELQERFGPLLVIPPLDL
jgi:hypothetical protein